MSDATTSLLRVLSQAFSDMNVETIRSRSWASVTFTGVRHNILLRISGPDRHAEMDRFLDDLEEREFNLRGHILADISVSSRSEDEHTLSLALEALTIEDS